MEQRFHEEIWEGESSRSPFGQFNVHVRPLGVPAPEVGYECNHFTLPNIHYNSSVVGIPCRKGVGLRIQKVEIMSRQNLQRSKEYPYHVMGKCLNGAFFPLPMDQVWKLMLSELHYLYRKKNLKVHAFVLMSNHFHLLCETPDENLDQLMQNFLRVTSLIFRHPWEPNYKWTLIQASSHYHQVYRYIHQNPLRAGIVDKVEEYPYSSLKDVPFPICSPIAMSFAGHEGENLWLNEKYDEEDLKLIRLGLRRFQFDVNQRKIKNFERLKKGPSFEGP